MTLNKNIYIKLCLASRYFWSLLGPFRVWTSSNYPHLFLSLAVFIQSLPANWSMSSIQRAFDLPLSLLPLGPLHFVRWRAGDVFYPFPGCACCNAFLTLILCQFFLQLTLWMVLMPHLHSPSAGTYFRQGVFVKDPGLATV